MPGLSNPILQRVTWTCLTIVIGLIVIKILLIAERRLLEKSSVDESIYAIITRTTKIILWILLILTALSMMDVRMGPLVTVLASIGAAFALAMKDTLGNVAGGVILLLTKPFAAGDEVEFDGKVGVVDQIDLMTTTMHTYDNREMIIPNGKITSDTLINATRRSVRRVDMSLNIPLENDIAEIKDTFCDIIDANDKILKEPTPHIGILGHGDDYSVLDVWVWCHTEDRFTIKQYMEEEAEKLLGKSGIRVIPQRINVNMDNIERV